MVTPVGFPFLSTPTKRYPGNSDPDMSFAKEQMALQNLSVSVVDSVRSTLNDSRSARSDGMSGRLHISNRMLCVMHICVKCSDRCRMNAVRAHENCSWSDGTDSRAFGIVSKFSSKLWGTPGDSKGQRIRRRIEPQQRKSRAIALFSKPRTRVRFPPPPSIFGFHRRCMHQ